MDSNTIDTTTTSTIPSRSGPHAIQLTIILVTLAAVLAAMLLAGPIEYGASSPLVRPDGPSGFWRLAVVTDDSYLPVVGHAPSVEDSPHVQPMTADQEASLARGWTAACLTWAELSVISFDDAVDCALNSAHRPSIASPGPTRGSSSDLANALAYMDHMFDINDDVQIAATGSLATEVHHDDLGRWPTTEVLAIANSTLKAQAARAVGASLVVVPAGNSHEFHSVLDDQTILITTSTLAGAVRGICEHTVTEICTSHVIPAR